MIDPDDVTAAMLDYAAEDLIAAAQRLYDPSRPLWNVMAIDLELERRGFYETHDRAHVVLQLMRRETEDVLASL